MNRSTMARRIAAALVVAASASVAIATTDVGAAPNGNGNGNGAQPAVASQSALVQLAGDPVSTAKNVDRGNGQRVNLQGTATKAYRAQLSAQRNELRQWLRKNAPAVKITGSFEVAVNAVSVELNGTDLATLRSAPMVVGAELQVEYGMHDAHPVDPDLALINAIDAWGGGGADGAGAGVKVAIVDSGIDQDHPCFDDLGDSDGPNNYTNDKVVVAKVFNNKAANLGYDASAVDSHGTHVAGTVACDYGTEAMVDGVTIPHTISGVAPAALLGNYNVFPGDVVNARSEDILNALEAAYADGMDIANMSLGGPASGIQDLLTMAVDNLDRAGMVVAVSAGNEGPGFSTVGSPGSAERALTAGASSVPHQVVRAISNNLGDETPAVVGDFGAIPASGVSGPIAVIAEDAANAGGVANLSTACTSVPTATSADQIAVVSRNVCDFSVKIRNVQVAGYAAAVVVNRVDGAFVMGQNGTPNQPTIPAVMIGYEGRAVVLGGATTVTLEAPKYVNPYGEPNVMADFSSQGPTDVDRRIKPDVVAPGVNVLSSIPGGGFAFFNGTSMASPHLAGAAAVVKSQHPLWGAEQIRSAIVNTADRDALSPFFEQPADDPNLVGAGLLDLAAAVAAPVTLDRVSVSFGQVPSGAGKSASADVHVLSGDVASVAVEAPTGAATFAASVDGGTITVTMSAPKQAATGPSWATVVLRDGSGDPLAHFRVYALIA